LCHGLRESTGLDVKIKWPNDAMVRDRKIGGVLVEVLPGQPAAAVIGIGANLNVAADEIDVADARVTSVLDETGLPCDRESVIAVVVGALERGYRSVEGGRSLSAEWAARSAVIGRRVALRSETASYAGTASGFGGDGELILDCDDGVKRRFNAGRLEILQRLPG
jgi:BirA family biotin operon repressor/biotin-[acetyl-CoA-carboxylase] ligase